MDNLDFILDQLSDITSHLEDIEFSLADEESIVTIGKLRSWKDDLVQILAGLEQLQNEQLAHGKDSARSEFSPLRELVSRLIDRAQRLQERVVDLCQMLQGEDKKYREFQRNKSRNDMIDSVNVFLFNHHHHNQNDMDLDDETAGANLMAHQQSFSQSDYYYSEQPFSPLSLYESSKLQFPSPPETPSNNYSAMGSPTARFYTPEIRQKIARIVNTHIPGHVCVVLYLGNNHSSVGLLETEKQKCNVIYSDLPGINGVYDSPTIMVKIFQEAMVQVRKILEKDVSHAVIVCPANLNMLQMAQIHRSADTAKLPIVHVFSACAISAFRHTHIDLQSEYRILSIYVDLPVITTASLVLENGFVEVKRMGMCYYGSGNQINHDAPNILLSPVHIENLEPNFELSSNKMMKNEELDGIDEVADAETMKKDLLFALRVPGDDWSQIYEVCVTGEYNEDLFSKICTTVQEKAGKSMNITQSRDGIHSGLFGGCIYSTMLRGGIIANDTKQLLLVDSIPFPLGIRVESNQVLPVIREGTPTPATGSVFAQPKQDKENAISFSLCEGEQTISSLTFPINPLPVKEQLIEVIYEIDSTKKLLITMKQWSGSPDEINKVLRDPIRNHHLKNVQTFTQTLDWHQLEPFMTKSLGGCDLIFPVQAEEAKRKGNNMHQKEEYNLAVDYFTKSINLNPINPIYYSNRSAAFLASGNFQAALKDADKCIELDIQWVKGYARRGAALIALNRLKEAKIAYQKGLEFDPTNEYMLTRVQSLESKCSCSIL